MIPGPIDCVRSTVPIINNIISLTIERTAVYLRTRLIKSWVQQNKISRSGPTMVGWIKRKPSVSVQKMNLEKNQETGQNLAQFGLNYYFWEWKPPAPVKYHCFLLKHARLAKSNKAILTKMSIQSLNLGHVGPVKPKSVYCTSNGLNNRLT